MQLLLVLRPPRFRDWLLLLVKSLVELEPLLHVTGLFLVDNAKCGVGHGRPHTGQRTNPTNTEGRATWRSEGVR